MAKMIRLDFRKAPPSSGGGQDRIPPGRYLLTVSKVSEPDATSKNGKPMITVNFKVARGDLTGKRVQDNFVFPQSADDQIFGLQRFHAMLISCGFAPPTNAGFRFDLDMLIGKSCWAEVNDNEIPAQGTRPARTVSRPDEYILPTQGQLEAAAPDEEEEDYAEDEDEEDDSLPFGEDDLGDEEYDDEEDEGDETEYEEPAPPPPEPIRQRRPRAAQPAAEVAAQQQRRAPAASQPAPAAPARQRNGRRPAPPADDSAFPFANS